MHALCDEECGAYRLGIGQNLAAPHPALFARKGNVRIRTQVDTASEECRDEPPAISERGAKRVGIGTEDPHLLCTLGWAREGSRSCLSSRLGEDHARQCGLARLPEGQDHRGSCMSARGRVPIHMVALGTTKNSDDQHSDRSRSLSHAGPPQVTFLDQSRRISPLLAVILFPSGSRRGRI